MLPPGEDARSCRSPCDGRRGGSCAPSSSRNATVRRGSTSWRGTVRIFKVSEDGKEQVLHHIAPGESFNDVAAFDGGPSPASAQAVEPTTVLLVPRQALLDLMRSYPEIAVAALQVLSTRLRPMSSLVEDLSLRHVVSRVAGVLLRPTPRGVSRTLPTRQELAAMVGTVREIATRALKHLEDLGAIRLGPRGRVAILDRRILERLSGTSSHGA